MAGNALTSAPGHNFRLFPKVVFKKGITKNLV